MDIILKEIVVIMKEETVNINKNLWKYFFRNIKRKNFK